MPELAPAEEDAARRDHPAGGLVAVDPRGDLFGEEPLRGALTRVRGVRRHHADDLLERAEGEDAEQALDVAVVAVEPVLVEAVRAGLRGIEPDVLTLALAELTAVGGGEERTDPPRGRRALPAGDEADPRGGGSPPGAAPPSPRPPLRP